MKIFNRDINEFEKAPEVKPVEKIVPFEELRKVTYSEFVKIPGSDNEIMVERLRTRTGVTIKKTYVDILNFVEIINEHLSDRYRLPYLEELATTYQYSFRNFYVDEKKYDAYRKSMAHSDDAELTGEIISKNKYLIRDPVNAGVPDKPKITGDKVPIKLANKAGFFHKLNEFGYPETVSEFKTEDADYWVYWKPHPGTYFILCGCDNHTLQVLKLSTTLKSSQTAKVPFRLVKIAEEEESEYANYMGKVI